MPLQATSGAASQDAFGGNGAAVVPTYIEDVFSAYLWTGTGATLSIVNNIDLATKGGLTWIKDRDVAYDNFLCDTERGALNELRSNTTQQQNSRSNSVTAFNADGFSLGTYSTVNSSAEKYVAWTLRKQPKFFDIQTWSGSGSNRTISHNLGSVPACIMVKAYSGTTANSQSWAVYHRSLANTEYLVLNSTDAKATGATRWNSTTPTSTVFSLGTDATVNASGNTYIAYIFAHDAGGFGLTGTDNVISCGSVANGSSLATLGWEPQWVLIKGSQGSTAVGDDWLIVDNMRGMVYSGNSPYLAANKSSAENYGGGGGPFIQPTPTGFQLSGLSGTGPFIYIAIRRGPMAVPTTGTSVFSPQIYTEIVTNPTTLTTSFPTDLHMISRRTGTTTFYVADRLRGSVLGNENFLETSSTVAETDYSSSPPLFTSNTGIVITNLFNNTSGQTDISYQFRRAPSFFDEVCYTGTGSATTFSHNLAAVPELMIVKQRNTTQDWLVYAAPLGNTKALYLNFNDASTTRSEWNNTTPTASVFSLNTNVSVNQSGGTFVAYLFATCAGVSKVGSYTGTGTTQTINCGFTAGSRFVMIKRTDSTGDWYVWDSARGIIAGNDPYLLLNSTAAEVTSTDYVDTANSGFEISSTAPAAINANGGTYIFLAIA